jgi:nucleotide-binding universal stress UspA family protein
MPSQRLIYLPLVAYPDPVGDEALAPAVAAAQHLGGRIEAQAFAVEVPPLRAPVGSFLIDIPDLVRTTEERSRAAAKELLSRVAQAAGAGAEIAATMMLVPLGQTGEAAAREARYRDITVLPLTPANAATADLAQAVVFGAGRPALLVPPQGRTPSFDRVAIAWDGSPAAARALGDALPLLPSGARADVLTLGDDKPMETSDLAGRLAESLVARGLQAGVADVRRDGRPVAVALQEAAIAAGAGLLVMGGFGHSRLREFILGGATAGVMADLRLPVLMSH